MMPMIKKKYFTPPKSTVNLEVYQIGTDFQDIFASFHNHIFKNKQKTQPSFVFLVPLSLYGK